MFGSVGARIVCSDEGQVAKYSTPLKISISQFWLFEVIKKLKTIWNLFKTGYAASSLERPKKVGVQNL